MSGRLAIVTGTGTEIGKTHLSEAILLALRGQHRVVGVKPVESGVAPGVETDADRLARASTFHVKHPAYAFADPISPHLAAREAGVVVDVPDLARALTSLRARADLLLVELPGGLFTPLSDTACNADLALALDPSFILLVCPDRLGVLHDVGATLRAATAAGLPLHATAVVAPAVADPSTGRNAAELTEVVRAPDVVTVPRARPADLAALAVIRALAERFVRAAR